MGILNITPDSFSDGGSLYGVSGIDEAGLLAKAGKMVESGVDFFDVGGESTRPGASPVSPAEELARVIPAVRLLKRNFQIPVSVDTSDPQIMRAAAEEGADMINDVRALRRPGAVEELARSRLAVCLMHMPSEPDAMQANPSYGNVVREVREYLHRHVQRCCDAGISRENIIIDPGFGFGKTLEHNLELFRELPAFSMDGLPLLVGVSRKRMIGAIVGKDVEYRVAGSVAMAMLAVQRGARIVRVHDVAETVDALKVLCAVEGKGF